MPVTITITDPSSTARADLLAVADMMYDLAGYGKKVHPTLETALQEYGAATETPAPVATAVAAAEALGVFTETVAANTEDECVVVHRDDRPVFDTNAIFGSTPAAAAVATTAAPPPPADATTAAAPPPPVLAVERDAAGYPYDGRIHSSSKAKVSDGTWRMKRGVDPAIVATVQAELRGAMAAPAPASFVPPVPGVTAAPPAPPAPPAPAAAAPVPPAPPAPAAPAAPAAEGPMTFPVLMQRITTGVASGALNQQSVLAAVQGAGLASLPLLATRPDLVPTVAAALGV
jgi:hypothetical protein